MGKAGFMARESGFMMMDAETSNGYGSDRGVGVLGVQPFAATPTNTTTTATCASYRSPVGMAGACLRYPFTAAQWQELERQALIFKYLKASVPVPNDLLIPITTNPLSHSTSSLRFANGSDPEPGRCRRTDGKKWRCSRDVAPDQKYCERHVQRNRPRSRKHVEVLSDVNNANASSPSLPPPPSAKRGGSIRPYPPPSPLFLSKPDFKSLPMETLGAALPYKDSRFINWMHKGDSTPMWSQSSNLHMEFAPPGFEGLGSHNQGDECALYLNPDLEHSDQRQMPGNFIDAWSMARPNSPKGTNKSPGDCKEKLSPSTLSLSMSSDNGVGEDMDQIHMGLGVNDSECDNTDGSKPQLFNWMTPVSWMGGNSTPGGPLGEVLRSGNAVSQAGSKPVSPRNANKSSGSGGGAINLMTDDWGGNSRHASPQGGWTATSSPSGVLHRILTSPSDSSGGNSPIYRSAAGNEVLQWMNQNM